MFDRLNAWKDDFRAILGPDSEATRIEVHPEKVVRLESVGHGRISEKWGSPEYTLGNVPDEFLIE